MSDLPATALDLPAAPGPLLREAIALAGRFGRDSEYTRGGGGNVSAKADGVLYIKPSGVPLGTLAVEDLVPLEMRPLLELLAREPAEQRPGAVADDAGDEDARDDDPVMRVAAAARLAEAGGRRPSVELLFHALLPDRLVLHTHPVIPNAVGCADDGAGLANRLFGERVLWVPYTDPGLPLARAILEARRAFGARTGHPAPPILLMQNHGVVIVGDTAARIEDLSAWLMSTVREALERSSAPTGAAPVEPAGPTSDPARARALVDAVGPTLRGLLANGRSLPIVTFDGSPRAAALATTEAGRAMALAGPLTPDQIVYAGSWPLVLDARGAAGVDGLPALLRERVEEHLRAHGVHPIVVIVPGVGIFAAGDSWSQADTARHIFLDAMRVSEGALALGGIRPLAEAERAFIETWEAEAYRRRVAALAHLGGRFAGRVAIVTGAAQGFGLAIATDLVKEGGHVVLADVNAAVAAAEARGLEDRFGPGRATAVPVDVTDERSTADCVHAAVEHYGGLDLLVSNAGVLRAGGVTSQPVADFDLVTRVNYRGYFLAVRAAAPVLALQHRANPAYLGDIVEINSKSGLVGSSRNSAYAGSKFGGIGLTQSFALELVGDGIKVNAICPGNYLDGPLWSDPENGLFVQYLREGKVPGATTVEDVRRSYEARVPMGRGCTPEDVLEALYYLIAQRYETGQALPVTGGQVMLS